MSPTTSVLVRSALLSAVSVAATVASGAGWASPVRIVLVLAFLLFMPGLALAEMLEVRDPLRQMALATGASLALETLVGLVLVYAGAFSTQRTMLIVLALTLIAVVVSVVRTWRRRGA
jgi:uncharacterized membrane protein